MDRKEKPLMEINLPFRLLSSGKIRRIFDLGKILPGKLLIVTLDVISAFDVVMNNGVLRKGKVLNEISAFHFKQTAGICPNHLITADFDSFPPALQKKLADYRELLIGRVMLVKKAKVIPVECIVRGRLLGSAWKAYQKDGAICGIELPAGMNKGDRLPAPIFTPSTKAEYGKHDENISFEEMAKIVGFKTAQLLRAYSLSLFCELANQAQLKGVELTDTKFEFGYLNGKIIQIDESGTPDSSRFDPDLSKQIIRDYLESISYDKKTPIYLPQKIIDKTSKNYLKIHEIITGQKVGV